MSTIVFRRVAGLLVLVLAVFSAQAVTAGNATPEQQLPEGQARVVIPVTGMTCGGCCIPVEKTVKKLKGVVDAKADYEKGLATVTYKTNKVTVEKIVEAINTTSFKASMPEKKES